MTVIKVTKKIEKPIRVISVRAWFERIPKTARKAIRKSQDEDVIDVMEGLGYVTYVDLDSLITLRDVGILMTAGLLTQEEVDSMLVDGQDYEKYNGVL